MNPVRRMLDRPDLECRVDRPTDLAGASGFANAETLTVLCALCGKHLNEPAKGEPMSDGICSECRNRQELVD